MRFDLLAASGCELRESASYHFGLRGKAIHGHVLLRGALVILSWTSEQSTLNTSPLWLPDIAEHVVECFPILLIS